MNQRLYFLAASMIFLQSATVGAMGFSQMTWQPRRRARTDCGTCSWSGVATMTASISALKNSFSDCLTISGCGSAIFRCAMKARQPSMFGSNTATSSAAGFRVTPSTHIAPIFNPSTPKRYFFMQLPFLCSLTKSPSHQENTNKTILMLFLCGFVSW